MYGRAISVRELQDKILGREIVTFKPTGGEATRAALELTGLKSVTIAGQELPARELIALAELPAAPKFRPLYEEWTDPHEVEMRRLYAEQERHQIAADEAQAPKTAGV